MSAPPLLRPSLWRRSVFPKAAATLAAALVATGLLALAVGGFFAYRGALGIVSRVVAVQIDALAEEVETRGAPLEGALAELPELLRYDLALRMPDPVHLVEADGTTSAVIRPDSAVFAGLPRTQEPPRWSAAQAAARDSLFAEALADGVLVIEMQPGALGTSYAFAPLFSASGEVAGGLFVAPLDATIQQVLEEPRRAFVRALVVVALGAVVLAVLLAALVTARLVRPLRRMTRRVERIGAGDYAARLGTGGTDEFGRLGAAIDDMAGAVETSVEALRAAGRMRRELVANVGHDLRTPLAALLGYVEEAQRMSAEGRAADAAESLAGAQRQGAYLERLVADLFELAVLDAAPTPAHALRTEPIPLAELLGEAAEAHRRAFREAEITFVADIPPDLPLVEADGVRLLRLCDNLLTNARRHTPEGGTVRLSARSESGAVVVDVADTGEGMAPEVLAHIFERYYRGSDARTRSGRTGLGLPISRAIAHAHGGTLEAASTPGEGSTFTLRLPVG